MIHEGFKYLQSENAQQENQIAARSKGYAVNCGVTKLALEALPGLLKIPEVNLQYFTRGDEAVDFEELPEEIQAALSEGVY